MDIDFRPLLWFGLAVGIGIGALVASLVWWMI